MKEKEAIDIYKDIKDAVRPICSLENSVEEIAINIYLTAMGIRPATMPFDVEGHDIMMKRFLKNKQVEAKLKNISGINVIIGPYFDSGNVILVYNTNMYNTHLKLKLKRLEEIANTGNRSVHPELHILIGEILGYICPSDMKNLYKGDIDDISFVIDEKEYMGVWCKSDKKIHERAYKLLTKMNRVLKLIGKHAELVITKKGEKKKAIKNNKTLSKRTSRTKTIKKY